MTLCLVMTCRLAPLRENINVLKTIRHFLELIRFSHTLFALPFALLAAVMAWRRSTRTFAGRDLLGILLCMVAARSFAMAFNRLADRRLDAANPRTAGRHLPAGILSVPQVAAFAGCCAVGFRRQHAAVSAESVAACTLSVPVLVFLAGYSYAKRFTALAHFWLGAALALSPVAAWIAIRGEAVLANPVDLLPALVLGGAVLTWVAGFDIIYACQDYDADRRAELHSVPVQARDSRRAATGRRVSFADRSFCSPACRWSIRCSGWIYWAGVAAVAVLLDLRAPARAAGRPFPRECRVFQRERRHQPGAVCGWQSGPVGGRRVILSCEQLGAEDGPARYPCIQHPASSIQHPSCSERPSPS